MIAHIAPIKRMPRTLGLLSYTVPTELETEVQLGQLVQIPIRTTIVYGIVFGIENTDNEKFKPLEAIVGRTPLFSGIHRALIEHMSSLYAISYGSAAKLFAPPLQKRKLSKQEWKKVDATKAEAKPLSKAKALMRIADIASITANLPKRSLLLVPHIEDIDDVLQTLPDGSNAAVWHSNLSVKQQFETWFAVQTGEIDYIVGTRTALFLPYPALSSIVLLYDHDNSHKSWDSHPRYDAYDLVELWARSYGAECLYASYSPRFDTYYKAAKDLVEADETFFDTLHAPIKHMKLVSMKDERKARNFDVLAEKVQAAVNEATGHVLLYVNRKGYATAVGCNDCEYVSRCASCGMSHIYYASTKTLRCHYCRSAERVPLSCPDCKGTDITPYGIGTEQVETYAKETFGALGRDIIRIDSNVSEIPEIPVTPSILIGTDKILSLVPWTDVSAIVVVHIDELLQYPDYRAMESVWHTLRHFSYNMPESAMCYIQTFHTDHTVIKSLQQPERLYRTDLKARKAFKLPPYTMLARLSTGGITEFAAQKESERVFSTLERTLTTSGVSATISYPIATYPTYFRGKNWYTILAKLNAETWETDLPKIIKLLPSNWRVDISPTSLLAP